MVMGSGWVGVVREGEEEAKYTNAKACSVKYVRGKNDKELVHQFIKIEAPSYVSLRWKQIHTDATDALPPKF